MFSISMVYIGLLKLPFYLKIFSKCLLTYYQIAFIIIRFELTIDKIKMYADNFHLAYSITQYSSSKQGISIPIFQKNRYANALLNASLSCYNYLVPTNY